MDDDLNTADAMGKMFELVRDANVALDENSPKQAIAAVLDALGEMAGVFGILTRKADDGDEKVKALIEARAKARAEKNWAESDRLRDEITALGYVPRRASEGAAGNEGDLRRGGKRPGDCGYAHTRSSLHGGCILLRKIARVGRALTFCRLRRRERRARPLLPKMRRNVESA